MVMDILPDTLLEYESKVHAANAGTKGSADKMEVALQKGVFLHSFRTRLCKYYSSNSPCAHGERCQFAHGVAELRAEAAISMGCLPPGFKTRLCNNFLTRGHCPHSDCCHFAHGIDELRIEAAIQQGYLPSSFKTKLCHFFTVEGCCSHCNRCHFAHGLGELRVVAAISQGVLPPTFKTRLCNFFAMQGQCPRGDFCHFAHGATELRQDEFVVSSALVGTNVPGMPLQENGVLQPGEAIVSNLAKPFSQWVTSERGQDQSDDIEGVPRSSSSTSLSQSSTSGASESSSSFAISSETSSSFNISSVTSSASSAQSSWLDLCFSPSIGSPPLSPPMGSSPTYSKITTSHPRPPFECNQTLLGGGVPQEGSSKTSEETLKMQKPPMQSRSSPLFHIHEKPANLHESLQIGTTTTPCAGPQSLPKRSLAFQQVGASSFFSPSATPSYASAITSPLAASTSSQALSAALPSSGGTAMQSTEIVQVAAAQWSQFGYSSNSRSTSFLQALGMYNNVGICSTNGDNKNDDDVCDSNSMSTSSDFTANNPHLQMQHIERRLLDLLKSPTTETITSSAIGSTVMGSIELPMVEMPMQRLPQEIL